MHTSGTRVIAFGMSIRLARMFVRPAGGVTAPGAYLAATAVPIASKSGTYAIPIGPPAR